MNIERLEQLRDYFAEFNNKEVGFNMEDYISNDCELYDHSGNHCKTVACIAGHAVFLFDRKNFLMDYAMENNAKLILGLTEEQAGELFLPTNINTKWDEITIPDAIKAIDNLIVGKPYIWEHLNVD